MGRNARRRVEARTHQKQAEMILRELPDLAGQKKPPCFLCGHKSDAWIVNGNRRERVCTNCSVLLSKGCFENDSTIVMVRHGTRECVTFSPRR